MDQTQPLRTGDRLEVYPTLLCLAWFSAAGRARKLYICQTLREHRDLRASFSPSWKTAEPTVKCGRARVRRKKSSHGVHGDTEAFYPLINRLNPVLNCAAPKLGRGPFGPNSQRQTRRRIFRDQIRQHADTRFSSSPEPLRFFGEGAPDHDQFLLPIVLVLVLVLGL